jgi:hypothetical protein
VDQRQQPLPLADSLAAPTGGMGASAPGADVNVEPAPPVQNPETVRGSHRMKEQPVTTDRFDLVKPGRLA